MPHKYFQKLDTVILRVQEIKTSTEWYSQVLGLSAIYEDAEEKLAVMDTGGDTNLTLWQLKHSESLPPTRAAGTYPIFLSGDAVAARDYLIECAVRVEALQTTGGVISFGFFDPDGNRLEVCQVEMPQP